MAPRDGVREVYQIKVLGCQIGVQSNFDPHRFSGVRVKPFEVQAYQRTWCCLVGGCQARARRVIAVLAPARAIRATAQV